MLLSLLAVGHFNPGNQLDRFVGETKSWIAASCLGKERGLRADHEMQVYFEARYTLYVGSSGGLDWEIC